MSFDQSNLLVRNNILTHSSGAIYLLSIFYTRKEVATRIAILYTGNILATAFAGLIAIGVFKMGGVAGLSGWRWLFILQGLSIPCHATILASPV